MRVLVRLDARLVEPVLWGRADESRAGEGDGVPGRLRRPGLVGVPGAFRSNANAHCGSHRSSYGNRVPV